MLYTADRNGVTDGSFYQLLEKINSPHPTVLVAWSENFVFNDALLSVKNPILVCACEYGWNFNLENSGTHIWGINSEKFPRYYNGDWVKFDNWVKENHPKILFKRELLKRDVSDKILPIEYVTDIPVQEPQSKEQFLSRPINVLNYWGRSNEERLRVHSEIWLNAYKNGGSVCDNIYYLNNFLLNESSQNKWVTLNIPHYARIDISEIMKISTMSKIGISMAGAGLRCFRHGEISTRSVMAMDDNKLAWSYSWNSGNCILMTRGEETETVNKWLQNPDDLYELYRNGIENAKNYYQPTYIQNYLEQTINKYA